MGRAFAEVMDDFHLVSFLLKQPGITSFDYQRGLIFKGFLLPNTSETIAAKVSCGQPVDSWITVYGEIPQIDRAFQLCPRNKLQDVLRNKSIASLYFNHCPSPSIVSIGLAGMLKPYLEHACMYKNDQIQAAIDLLKQSRTAVFMKITYPLPALEKLYSLGVRRWNTEDFVMKYAHHSALLDIPLETFFWALDHKLDDHLVSDGPHSTVLFLKTIARFHHISVHNGRQVGELFYRVSKLLPPDSSVVSESE